MRRTAVGWALACVTLVLASSLDAQTPRRFLPDPALVPRLTVGPLEPRTAARLVLSLESPTAFGEVVEGEAAFGTTLGLLRLGGTGPDDLVMLGIGGGIFARFNMETVERDLISSDWIFVLPLYVRRDRHWARLQYLHTSAHLGDEYIERFGVERVAHARDALDGVVSFGLASGLRLHAGVRWSPVIDPPEDERFAVRGGVEFTPLSGVSLRPFVAADLAADANTDWRLRIDARTGLWLTPSAQWPSARIELGFYHGPPYQGQFEDGTHTGFSVGGAVGL